MRRILGGHAKVGDRTIAEYSRDELAEPLRMVELLYTWIRASEFLPDANRSGRWSQGRRGPNWYPETLGGNSEAQEKVATESEDESTCGEVASEAGSSLGVEAEGSVPTMVASGTEDSDDGVHPVSADEREEEEIVAAAAETRRVQADGERVAYETSVRSLPIGGLFQHDPDDVGRARLTLHCGDPDDEERLRCRRAIHRDGGVVYRRLMQWPLFSGGECGQCMPAEERAAERRGD
jgi:hypothetical protein